MTGSRGGGEEGNETRQEMWRSCNDEGKQARKKKKLRDEKNEEVQERMDGGNVE